MVHIEQFIANPKKWVGVLPGLRFEYNLGWNFVRNVAEKVNKWTVKKCTNGKPSQKSKRKRVVCWTWNGRLASSALERIIMLLSGFVSRIGDKVRFKTIPFSFRERRGADVDCRVKIGERHFFINGKKV